MEAFTKMEVTQRVKNQGTGARNLLVPQDQAGLLPAQPGFAARSRPGRLTPTPLTLPAASK